MWRRIITGIAITKRRCSEPGNFWFFLISVQILKFKVQPHLFHTTTDNSQQKQSKSSEDDNFTNVLANGQICIFVRAYEKRGEGINAFIAYKIETKVF